MEEWWHKYVGLVPGAEDFYPEEEWLELVSTNENHLHTYRYPCESPRALVFVFHGLGGHANASAHVAKRFSEENILALSFDYENHGKSGGTPGKITNIDNYITDACKYIEEAKTRYPGLPVFIAGESLGGGIAVCVSLRIEIDGMILISPAVGLMTKAKKLHYRMGISLLRRLPFLRIPKPNHNLVCNNQNLGPFKREDPHSYTGYGYCSTIIAFLDFFDKIETMHDQVETPFFIVQGGLDELCEPEVANKFLNTARSKDKMFLLVPELNHSVSDEFKIYELLEDMVKWMDERIL